MKNLRLIIYFLLSIFFLNIEEILASSESSLINSTINNYSETNTSEDGTLEYIYIRRKSGFDGKVRSICFGINCRYDESVAAQLKIDETEPFAISSNLETTTNETSNVSNPINTTFDDHMTNQEELATADSESKKSLPLVFFSRQRTRRSIKDSSSNFNDLQAEEAKVFRPLFVYRNQVAKRMKLRKEKGTAHNRGSQRNKLSEYRYYYYPHHYYFNTPRKYSRQ